MLAPLATRKHDRTVPDSISKTIPSRHLDYTEGAGREKDVCHDFRYRGHIIAHNCISTTTWKVRLRDGPLTHVRSYKLMYARDRQHVHKRARTHVHIFGQHYAKVRKVTSDSRMKSSRGAPFSPF